MRDPHRPPPVPTRHHCRLPLQLPRLEPSLNRCLSRRHRRSARTAPHGRLRRHEKRRSNGSSGAWGPGRKAAAGGERKVRRHPEQARDCPFWSAARVPMMPLGAVGCRVGCRGVRRGVQQVPVPFVRPRFNPLPRLRGGTKDERKPPFPQETKTCSPDAV